MWKIPLFKIYWDGDDVEAVTESIRSGMNWATGPNVAKFEESIASYVGTEYAITFNSGTSALHAALLAHEVQKGDEVIVPSFTFIATANAPLFVGAKPVFADIEEETFGLDPEDVKEKITENTKAIIPVHYGGCPCKIRALKEIAEDHNLILIEDAAESLGARIGDKKVGTFGDSAMFSFCAPKVITTGEGGVMVTNSKEIYEKVKLIRSHGRLEMQDYFSSAEYLDYITVGYNFRMSNITAALGITQLEKIDKIIEMRRENADYMNRNLFKIKAIKIPSPPKDYFHIYQMYSIEIKNGKERRDDLAKYLNKRGIMTKIYFDPIHHSHFYKDKLGYNDKLPITEKTSSTILTLPMYPSLQQKEMDYITKNLSLFFSEHDAGGEINE
ncbi:MAG: DegT/DnrJ/EryC1/StrS family aminotransferase [Thermoplasmata archaeon]|nr:MAG: DegT/DnrJ/EryC1/StrS family aminotransferase [Thermoplasmata archaeon]